MVNIIQKNNVHNFENVLHSGETKPFEKMSGGTQNAKD
jgi:hypothetical protein